MIFKFKLTQEQMEIVKTEHEKALREYKKGLPGSVFCQIGLFKNSDEDLYAKGCFIPNIPALMITGIISDVLEDESD